MIEFLKNLFKCSRKESKKCMTHPNKGVYAMPLPRKKKNLVEEALDRLENIEGVIIDRFEDGSYGIGIDSSKTDLTPEMIVSMIKRHIQEGE